MSFDKPARGLLVFICDACDDTFEVTEDLHDFRECWIKAREEGWVLRDGEHYCTSCAELK